MDRHTATKHLGQAVTRTDRQWEARILVDAAASGTPAPAHPPFTIALSRQAGTCANAISTHLGERLGWPVYDRALLERVAQEMGVRPRQLESIDERDQGWLQQSVAAFGGVPVVDSEVYVHRLVGAITELAHHGHCVIVGRGAAQFLPRESTLRVYLVGELAERVAAIQQQFGLSEAEAAQRVADLDRERNRFIKNHFLKDPSDPLLYDLTLNTSRLTAEECVEVIVTALQRLQARPRTRPVVAQP